MQRLILMRHGKAERASMAIDDSERRLTERGVSDARIMGSLLKTEALIPDLALVSSALRTQETWAAVSENFPNVRVQVRQGLYLASVGHLVEVVERMGAPDETLMVVGHNPGIHDLAHRLLRDSSAPPSIMAKLQTGFPTSTVAAFTVDTAGRYDYDGLFFVRDYGGGGGE
ncbi:MAG TPA: histidine phosphatase family protein [Caulobacteraceae bacterium]|jgi:phosphohistidine phosphatase|nr:histidine phosphatase family protein [Caulobacteraceae bacterium]